MYEKTRKAWDDLEEKIGVKTKAMLDDSSDKEAIREYMARMKPAYDEFREKAKEFRDTLSKLNQIIQDFERIAGNMPPLRIQCMRVCVNALTGIMRTEMPRIFGIDGSDMDKIIRAMEQDRRINAHLETLEEMPYEQYLQTFEWQQRRDQARDQALRDAGNRCQLCNKSKFLNVHHKTYERRGHELPEDLIVLCRDCHARFHNKLTNSQDQRAQEIQAWVLKSIEEDEQ